MQQPIDLSPELERQQRIADILLMRELDSRMGLIRYEIENILLELNIRFIQYLSQSPYSIEYLALQCLQDFKKHLFILQSNPRALDKSLPVASLKDGTMLYLFAYMKEDFKGDDPNATEIFTTTKPIE